MEGLVKVCRFPRAGTGDDLASEASTPERPGRLSKWGTTMHARLRQPVGALIATGLAASVLVLGVVPAATAVDGTLSGTVTAQGGGGDLSDVDVEVYRLEEGDWRWFDDTSTAPDGTWSIPVPAGEYRVGFEDNTDVYAAEFYNNADTVEEASTVQVPGPAVDVVLAPSAHIRGTVRDENGAPLPFVYVEAYRTVVVDGRTEYRQVGFAETANLAAPTGTYDIGGIPGGSYLLRFWDGKADGAHTYATEWYANKPNRYVASPVTVDDGATNATPADAQLELSSEISGVLYDTVSGTPVDNGTVWVYTQVGNAYPEVDEVDVEPDGTYVVDGLSADTYYVEFRADVVGGQAGEYWDDEPSVLTATAIDLGVGETETASPVLVFGENTAPSLKPGTPPSIAGTPQVGTTLTASPGTWTPAPTTIRYSWYAGEEQRQDGSSNTYVPVVADIGKEISVDVYVSATGYDTSRGSAVASGLVLPAPVPPPVTTSPVVTPPVVTPPPVDVPTALARALAALKVTGKPKVGRTVKVANLDLDLRTAVTYRFQWYAGTRKIAKATKSKLKVVAAMKGKKLSVKVTGKAASTTKSVKLKVGTVR